MALTWDQFGNLGLSTAQKNKLSAMAAVGVALKNQSTPDISGVTASQAKAIIAFFHDVNALMGAAHRGARYVVKKLKDDAASAAEAAIPSGSL